MEKRFRFWLYLIGIIVALLVAEQLYTTTLFHKKRYIKGHLHEVACGPRSMLSQMIEVARSEKDYESLAELSSMQEYLKNACEDLEKYLYEKATEKEIELLYAVVSKTMETRYDPH